MPAASKFRYRLVVLALSLAIIVLDQITKALVVSYIPVQTVGFQFLGDFLRIIHVRNPGIAFSLGAGSSEILRFVAFTIVPGAVLAVLLVFLLRSADLTRLQRWSLAAILGGGCGNLLDRILRPEGVVDFIDVKFYGIFGWERWPTFNVADSSVVVGGILLLCAIVFQGRKKS